MNVGKPPRDFTQWRRDAYGRPEDAAYTFGFHLITKCRDSALATLPAAANAEMIAAVENAVDTSLNYLCGMLEGVMRLEAGAKHSIELTLVVEVKDDCNRSVEAHQISPCKMDLPIGYWKWAKDREFQ